jgi:hypothetical protein
MEMQVVAGREQDASVPTVVIIAIGYVFGDLRIGLIRIDLPIGKRVVEISVVILI